MTKQILIFCLLLLSKSNLCGQIYSRKQLNNLELQLNEKNGIQKINALLELSEGFSNFQLDTAFLYAKEAGVLSLNGRYDWGIYKSLYCVSKIKIENLPIKKVIPLVKKCINWFEANAYKSDALYARILYVECIKNLKGEAEASTIAENNLELAKELGDFRLLGLTWFDISKYKSIINKNKIYNHPLDSSSTYLNLSDDSLSIFLVDLIKNNQNKGSLETIDKYCNLLMKAQKWRNSRLIILSSIYIHDNYSIINQQDSVSLYESNLFHFSKVFESEKLLSRIHRRVLGVSAFGGNYDKAIHSGKQSLRISNKNGYYTRKSKLLLILSLIYNSIGDTEMSIELTLEGIELAKLQNDEIMVHKLNISLGALYTHFFENEKAEKVLLENKYWLDTIQGFDRKIDFRQANNSCLGKVYIQQKRFEEAINCFKLCILDARDNKRALVHINFLILITYLNKDDIFNATIQYNKIFKEFDNNIINSQLNFDLAEGRLLLGQGKFKAAIVKLENYLQNFKITKLDPNYLIAHDALHKAYKKNGDYKLAFESLTICNSIQDSVSDSQIKENTLEMKSDYEISLKEAEISNLQKQQEIQALKLIQQNSALELRKSYNIILGFGALLILVIGYWLFHRYRNTKEKEKLKSEARQVELELANLQANQKAELAEVKNMLFANVSHEFRTPLTLIKVPTQNYMAKIPMEDQPVFEGILKNTDHLLKMVDELLGFSKMESGSVELRQSIFSVNHLLTQTKAIFDSLFKDKQISFICENLDESLLFNGDENRLKVVLNNLLKNAYNHTPENGTVYFKVKIVDELAKSGLSITVSNTGDGILEKDLPFIFDRFYRGDERNYVGNGIGLSLCKQIVELHDGMIKVNCDRLNTVHFNVELPGILISDVNVLTPPINELQIQDSKSETHHLLNDTELSEADVYDVLVVEDNIEMREVLNSVLNQDFRLHFAENGEVGEQMALDLQPDLILSDIMMPKKDGLELLASLRGNSETNHIPIVLLTAKSSVESQIIGLNHDADDYISKPFDSSLLISKIHNILRQRKMLQKRLIENPFVKSKTVKCNAIDAEFIDKAQYVLEGNFHNGDFSVNEFCQELALNRNSVHNKIKAYTNQSTAQYIKNFRLKKAILMIIETEVSMNEIYINTGFNSPQAFNKAFKGEFSMTPSEYRNLNKSI